jgi:phosphatidate cytidylyltransferase
MMAFNWPVFRTRASTALVFVLVMLAGLLWNRWSFFILFSIVHFGAWFEYIKLVGQFNPDYKKISSFHRWAVMIGGWCLLLFFTNDQLQVAGISLTQAGFWLGVLFMVLLPVIMFLETKLVFLKNLGYSISGLIYISLSFGLLNELRNHWQEASYQLSHTIPLLIIFSIWINDTMAYIVGSLIGKTPLSAISPKKTWEGTVGGIILTIVAMGILAGATGRLDVIHACIMAAIAALAGTFGDLFESKLKRMAGVKDSGSIMPGHGGFLDRFDSLLFAAPAVWIYAYFFL